MKAGCLVIVALGGRESYVLKTGILVEQLKNLYALLYYSSLLWFRSTIRRMAVFGFELVQI